jgi:hypothetical protein
MKEETRDLILNIIIFLILWMINIAIVYIICQTMLYSFDYCVTHTCECTHSYGIQDMLWFITPFLYTIVPAYYCLSVIPNRMVT